VKSRRGNGRPSASLFKRRKPAKLTGDIEKDIAALMVGPFDEQHPNAQTLLPALFERERTRSKKVIASWPNSSHAKIAREILGDLDHLLRNVNAIDSQDDRHSIVLDAMRFASRSRDLDMNIAFAGTVDEKRRIARRQAKAGKQSAKLSLKKYKAAKARAGDPSARGYRKRLASFAGVTLPTLRNFERRRRNRERR
jgi:hypothetical protein